MDKTKQYFIVFFFGGLLYGLMELSFRGRTHWTMVLTGGAAFLIIYIINTEYVFLNFFLRCALGCVVITVLEFGVGMIVNVIFKLDVWDYSQMRFNILGQICPSFTALWFLLNIPAVFLCREINRSFRLLH